MKTQNIKRTELKKIYPKVCESWQRVILELSFLQEGDTIEVEETVIIKAHNEADPDQKKLIEKYFNITSNKIQDKYNTWEKVLEALRLDESEVVPFNKKKLTSEEKSINAQAKLFKITELYNEGWKPNWKNQSEYKWRPYKYFSGGSVAVLGDHGYCIYLHTASGLYFKTKELSEASYKNFEEIYNDYFMI